MTGASAGRRTRVAVVVLLLTLLSACDSDGDSASPDGSTTTPVAVEGKTPAGKFFVIAGEQSLNADLYELNFSPVRLTRLTTDARIGGVDGCAQQVVVSSASQGLGFADTIQAFRGGELRPVPGLGAPKGSGPSVSPDCRIAFVDVDRSAPELADRLHIWDPRSGSENVVQRTPAIGGFDLGPDGQIALVENTPEQPGQPFFAKALVIIGADQAPRSIPPPGPDLGALRWGRSDVMAIRRNAEQSILFFNPKNDQRSELAGWYPLAWSPDGTQLLVSDAKDHRSLGVIDRTDLSKVRGMGIADIGVFDAAWLPADGSP